MLTTFDWPDCAFVSYPVSYAKATTESDEMLKTKSRFPHLNSRAQFPCGTLHLAYT